MTSTELRRRFLEFFSKRGHKIVPSSSLLSDDLSVLLTTAGMQQFKPYFVGQGDPMKDFGGKNVASVQKCFRTSDIDEVGDETHLTFFEMLGNFSFGGYFKEEAIKYAHEFIVTGLGLKIDYVSVFAGDAEVPEDKASAATWQALGVTDIRKANRSDNFWGPTGNEGPCGPTTEIYVRGVEIWNLVFNEYYQYPDSASGGLEKLKTPGVDTGMGLERLAMVVQNTPTIFETDLFGFMFRYLPPGLAIRCKRIVCDHIRAVSFLISAGIRPNNKGVDYVLRRLLRRLIVFAQDFNIVELLHVLKSEYQVSYPELISAPVLEVFDAEYHQFAKALQSGQRELKKLSAIDAITAFKLYESYGLPYEAIKDHAPNLRRDEFEAEFKKHQEVSRAGVTAKFAGGLADHQPATIKLHTANHLLLAALKTVLGPEVKQRGSNITAGRLRFDFSYSQKLTDEQKHQVEELVNQKIKEDLPVRQKEMNRTEAEKLGAEMEFGQKYGERVSVYFIEDQTGTTFSAEFCAGPHVTRTGELGPATAGRGPFRIVKEEAVAAGIRRIKAVLE